MYKFKLEGTFLEKPVLTLEGVSIPYLTMSSTYYPAETTQGPDGPVITAPEFCSLNFSLSQKVGNLESHTMYRVKASTDGQLTFSEVDCAEAGIPPQFVKKKKKDSPKEEKDESPKERKTEKESEEASAGDSMEPKVCAKCGKKMVDGKCSGKCSTDAAKGTTCLKCGAPLDAQDKCPQCSPPIKEAKKDACADAKYATIALLNKLRAGEITAALQYEVYSVIVPSLHMPGLADIFSEHEEQEWGHSATLAQRIHELGGTPVADLNTIAALCPFSISHDTMPKDMVATIRKQEEQAVSDYKAAILQCQADPTTRLMLEEILGDEEEHLTDAQSLLEGNSATASKKIMVEPVALPNESKGKAKSGLALLIDYAKVL